VQIDLAREQAAKPSVKPRFPPILTSQFNSGVGKRQTDKRESTFSTLHQASQIARSVGNDANFSTTTTTATITIAHRQRAIYPRISAT